MSTHERPGVYTNYSVSGIVRGSAGQGGAVGLAATAASGTAGNVVAVTDYAAALEAFGNGNLAALVKVLLKNGAPVVYCCAVGEAGDAAGNVTADDYEAAFAALMDAGEIRYMVCDSREADVHKRLLDAITHADEKSKYRIGIVESDGETIDALTGAAKALNSERMVLVSHHEAGGTPGSVAAAVCGVIAGESDPALPLNGAALGGFTATDGALGVNFSDADLTLLIQGGVTPLETVNGSVSVVRGITTRTTTGGAADAAWREINTILIVDTLLPAIREALRADFARAKNTVQTRGAIRTRTVIELENFLSREIIDGYDNVTVTPSEDDPTVCVVSFSFSVAHGLNVIELSVSITV